jgi:hypothetical protein
VEATAVLSHGRAVGVPRRLICMIKTIKLHKFWSNYAEDVLLISGAIIVLVGLYLLAAYLFITSSGQDMMF